jgi:2-dehydropantoate 2-reductase
MPGLKSSSLVGFTRTCFVWDFSLPEVTEMHIVIVGPGGIGGCLGSYLYLAGADVEFLCETEEDADYLQRNGLLLTRDGEPAHEIKAKFRRSQGYSGSPDLLIMAVKAGDTEQAIRCVEHARPTASGTIQNGLTCFRKMQGAFPNGQFIGLVTRLTSERKGNRIVVRDNKAPTYLEWSVKQAETPARFASLLLKSGLDLQFLDTIIDLEWSKLVSWIPQSLAAVAFDRGYPDIYEDPEIIRFQIRVAKDIIRVADSLGVQLMDRPFIPVAPFLRDEPELMKYLLDYGRKLRESGMQGYVPSMLKDVREQKTTELDETAGEICRLGQESGVDISALQEAYDKCRNKSL